MGKKLDNLLCAHSTTYTIPAFVVVLIKSLNPQSGSVKRSYYYFHFTKAKPGIKVLSNMSELVESNLNPDSLTLAPRVWPPCWTHFWCSVSGWESKHGVSPASLWALALWEKAVHCVCSGVLGYKSRLSTISWCMSVIFDLWEGSLWF